MVLRHKEAAAGPRAPLSVCPNIRVRYTVNIPTESNIGSAVKTFQVVNKGNVPCDRQFPCSTDGNWKASTGSASLDAGAGNESEMSELLASPGPALLLGSIRAAL